MNRGLASLLLAVGCTASAPESPAPRVAPPASPSPDDVEAMALQCDGAALLGVGSEAIAELTPSATQPSARLLSLWERDRSSEGALVEALTAELGRAPPGWWVDVLRSGHGGKGMARFYDLRRTESSDRRGPLEVGPGGVRVRPGVALVESGDGLAYDLSMGRVPLGPIPAEGTAIEVVRAHAGSTLFVATFEPGAGGFRFPLRAVESDGSESWSAEVCAADRQALGGIGSMTVELVVLEDAPEQPGVKERTPVRGLAVFTAETHGVTVEVFDVETGSRTLAWTSDLWSSRG